MLRDGLQDPEYLIRLARRFEQDRELPTVRGSVRFHNRHPLRSDDLAPGRVRALGVEQSNSSFIYSDRHILKLFRALEPELNPETEILAFLDRRGIDFVPALEAEAEYRPATTGEPVSLAVLQSFIPSRGDGWSHVQETLRQAAAGGDDGWADRLADHWSALERLGVLTARLHLALATGGDDPRFAPVPCGPGEAAFMETQLRRSWELARHSAQAALAADRLDEAARAQAERLFASDAPLDTLAGVPRILARTGRSLIRYHGDYHLGQVLARGEGDWVILDFEGEPLRDIRERKRKTCPLKDTAGMLRSLNYAGEVFTAEAHDPRRAWLARDWEARAREAFLRGYFQTAQPGEAGFLPLSREDSATLLRFFEAEKALYELNYELNNRPGWVHIPLQGLRRLLSSAGPDRTLFGRTLSRPLVRVAPHLYRKSDAGDGIRGQGDAPRGPRTSPAGATRPHHPIHAGKGFRPPGSFSGMAALARNLRTRRTPAGAARLPEWRP